MQSVWTLLAGIIALTLPTAAYGGGGGDTRSCVADSRNLNSWTVRHFSYNETYIFTTPSHQNSYGVVNFTLENGAAEYTPVTCYASSSVLTEFFFGNYYRDCRGVPDGEEASFSFNRVANVNELRINQTWHCPDDDGAGFEAKGSVKLDLDCEVDEWQNPDWSNGPPYEFYSTRYVTCEPVTVSVPVDEVREISG
ncbi:hypothetical protein PHISP_02270 [Aspergillus sp. HF37]|nr:hypothetical protein PHISP_02270 [Aspergillus sp. HF37]